MRCPECGEQTSVRNSRPKDTRPLSGSHVPKGIQEAAGLDWTVFRLRACRAADCGKTFWTAEILVEDINEGEPIPSRPRGRPKKARR